MTAAKRAAFHRARPPNTVRAMILLTRAVRARVQVSFTEASQELERNGFDVEAAVRTFLAAGRIPVDPATVKAPEPVLSVYDHAASAIAIRAPFDGIFESPGKDIAALVSAVDAIEAGGAQLFGMAFDSSERKAFRPLAAVARAHLSAWRCRLEAEHGAEGAKLVDTIAARGRITLPEMTSRAVLAMSSAPSAKERAFFQRLSAGVDAGLLRAGAPDPERLQAFAARYEASDDAQLPAAYLRLIARFNGLEVAQPDQPFHVAVVPPTELGEVTIHPLEVGNNHFLLDDLDLEGIELPFVFGELPGGGYLVFDATAEGAPVFWAAEDFASEPPTPLTATFVEFLTEWAAAEWSLAVVLGRKHVLGWAQE